jgi:predicted amidophosphoribosyltransferase
MEALDRELARKTVKNYCCSNCWGELEILPDLRENGMYFVTCRRCGEQTKGYVSQYYANTRRSESGFEKMDVTRMLRKCGILKAEVKTVGANLRELGF